MAINKKIGEKIRQLRESKMMSIGQMAESSGLDEKQIEAVEQTGKFSSLSPLMKIAQVLDVRLAALFEDHSSTGLAGPVVCRKDQYEKVASFSTKDSSLHRHMDYFSLSAAKAGHRMEPFVIQIEPIKKGVDFVLSTHEGEEFIYCLEGIVEIKYGTKTYILEEGDSIYYDTIVEHHVQAGGDSKAKILAVVYSPF